MISLASQPCLLDLTQTTDFFFASKDLSTVSKLERDIESLVESPAATPQLLGGDVGPVREEDGPGFWIRRT